MCVGLVTKVDVALPRQSPPAYGYALENVLTIPPVPLDVGLADLYDTATLSASIHPKRHKSEKLGPCGITQLGKLTFFWAVCLSI